MNQRSHPAPANGEETLLRLERVNKVFKVASGEAHVLKDVSVTIRQGEFVSIVGRSGSGKSTLINMMTGIDHPTSGTVRVGSVRLDRLSEGKLSVWRGSIMGVVFQFFQLLPMLTLLENILLPMDFAGRIHPAERERRARHLLALVELEGCADLLPAELSGGQQQSAAVARSLANDPPIIMADEPTGNLDSRSAEKVFGIFEQLAAQGKTILMVTHDEGLSRRARRRLVIADGELLNEHITRAFPSLPHSELLRLSHAVQPFGLSAGESLALGRGPLLAWATRGELVMEEPGPPMPAREWQPLSVTGSRLEGPPEVIIRSPGGAMGMQASGPALSALLDQAPALERLLSEQAAMQPKGGTNARRRGREKPR